MRIRTEGDYAHRLDVIKAAMDALNENTETAAVLAIIVMMVGFRGLL
ncbi:hypothetical protein KI372_00445 [Halobacterium salinarum]|nr:hypothetical protein [Halobacterium salinarum]MCF2206890.1 hypothetical protein [Halobacterium salinarum]MCF2239940.1 hypothetical protein [Halobacterium salinarum]